MFGISHFVVNSDGTFPFDHPRISEVLGRNEMATYFPEDSFKVLHNDVVKDSDVGRSLLNYVVLRL